MLIVVLSLVGSPLMTPRILPYVLPYITPFKEFRLLRALRSAVTGAGCEV